MLFIRQGSSLSIVTALQTRQLGIRGLIYSREGVRFSAALLFADQPIFWWGHRGKLPGKEVWHSHSAEVKNMQSYSCTSSCLHVVVPNQAQGQHTPFTFLCYVLWVCLNWFGSGEHYWGIVILLAVHNLNLTLCFSLEGVAGFCFLQFSLLAEGWSCHLNLIKNTTSTFNVGYVKRQIFNSVIISCFE